MRDDVIEKVVDFDLGCEPSPSVPAETVLQDGWSTFLLFFAVSRGKNERGKLDDLGVAVVNCDGCVQSKFGYPNDEGQLEHRLYTQELSKRGESVFEVLNSKWALEVKSQMKESAVRIWGQRNMLDQVNTDAEIRHFVVFLKEATFECLSTRLVVDRFCGSFAEAQEYVLKVFDSH